MLSANSGYDTLRFLWWKAARLVMGADENKAVLGTFFNLGQGLTPCGKMLLTGYNKTETMALLEEEGQEEGRDMLVNLILRLSSLSRTDGITRCLLDGNNYTQLSHPSEFIKAPDDPSAQHHPDQHMDSHAFRETYYLKTELAAFCRDNNLSTAGSKEELTERIAFFLDTGKRMDPPSRAITHSKRPDDISGQSIIEEGFVCTETHRAFFLKAIGPSFTFIVPFQKWLKENAGKTYDEAVAAYHELRKEKADNGQTGRHTIGKQFEYNAYIRDFFADNAGKTLDDAIRCWKYKRDLKGHNRYERSDLTALAKE